MSEQVSSLAVDALRERASRDREPSWLTDRRVAAVAAFDKLPPPAFLRTDLSDLDLPALAERAGAARDGTQVARTAPKVEGVTVLDLATAAREHEDLVRPDLLERIVAADHGRIEALHAAAWTHGTFVHVEKGVECDEPIVQDVAVGPHGALTHVFVNAAPLAKLTILSRLKGAPGDGLVTAMAEIVAQDGAKVAFAGVQDLAVGPTHLSVKRAHVARDAEVTWMDAQFGSARTVAMTESILKEPGAATTNYGAFFGSGKQHFDVTSSALHRARSTRSDLRTKGALTDDAYAAYYGIVNIGPEAPGSEGHQQETTLILSDRARADAIPKLDVENNQVQASHSAAVGQLDNDEVFYVQSRGLNEHAARRLLVEGFFEPLLLEIPLEDVRDEMRAGISGRLA